MVRFIDRRDIDGTPIPQGWICYNGDLYFSDGVCKQPGRAIVDEDGRWCYVAACDNEQHAAEALAYHEKTRSTSWAWGTYDWPTGEVA